MYFISSVYFLKQSFFKIQSKDAEKTSTLKPKNSRKSHRKLMSFWCLFRIFWNKFWRWGRYKSLSILKMNMEAHTRPLSPALISRKSWHPRLQNLNAILIVLPSAFCRPSFLLLIRNLSKTYLAFHFEIRIWHSKLTGIISASKIGLHGFRMGFGTFSYYLSRTNFWKKSTNVKTKVAWEPWHKVALLAPPLPIEQGHWKCHLVSRISSYLSDQH